MTDAAREDIATMPDGRRVALLTRVPVGREPRAVVQILHGLSEHCGRYARFADELAACGFAVVAHDHRGHDGESLAGHFADADGWRKVLDDVAGVHEAAVARWPGVPVVLFGHSMGSYIAQAYVMRQPGSVQALVLSGSTFAPRWRLWLGRLGAAVEAWRHGRRYRSAALNAQAFGSFNRRFEPARTEAEVDRYVADPRCGGVPSAGLWLDLLGGLLDIGRRRSLQRVPAGLPVLVTGGSDDPVGGRPGMERLAHRYRETGHERVGVEIFDGARHEMLNETNREEFVRVVIGWIEDVIDETAGRGHRG